MPQWNLLRLSVPLEQSEIAAQILHDAGCTGTQIDDRALILDESEDASFAPRETAIVTGYLEPHLDVQSAKSQVASTCSDLNLSVTIETEAIDDADWSTNWRENFPPLSIGRFRIVPSWETNVPDSENLIELRLDPGLAFGTGQHPTTHLCLELIGEVLPPIVGTNASATTSASTCRCLDVGCGSGILSIAAAKLGAQVLASDLDTWCVEATTENARENGVEIEVVEAAGADWTSEQFDVVIANLMSDLLINLAPQLFARCKSASICILSGISSPRADDVESAMHAAGFETIEKRERDGESRGDYTERWAAFVLKRAN